MTEETPVNPLQEERDAIERIALTYDGLMFHRYLTRVLEGVILTPIDGALRDHNGRRTLARDIRDIMSKGIEQNRGRTDADRPLLAASSGPVSVARAGGARRRGIDAPGWGPEPDTDSGGDKA